MIYMLLLTSCNGEQVQTPPPDFTDERIPEVSNSITIDVYIDASKSMEGFLVQEITSRYQNTIQLLKRAALTGWERANIKFFKFGSSIIDLGEDGYLDAAKRPFYSDIEGLHSHTFIDNVIQKANSNNLTVIISDLFQDTGDITRVTSLIKEKYFDKGLAVGILGIKSQFQGMVYDIGLQNLKFYYDSGTEEPKRYRPFYLLLLGNHSDIERYYQILSGRIPASSETGFTIFSKYLNSSAISTEDVQIPRSQIDNLAKTSKIIPRNYDGGSIPQFVIQRGSRSSQFVLERNLHFYNNTLGFDQNSFEIQVRSWLYRKGVWETCPLVADSLFLDEMTLTEGTLKFRANIKPTYLSSDGVYLFAVTFQPKSFLIPEWIKQWDMPQDQIDGWNKIPKSFDGSTTYNLRFLVNDMSELISRFNRPTVYVARFVIKRG